MHLLLNILLMIFLFLAFWQDRSSRSIHIAIFGALLIVAFAISFGDNLEWQIIGLNTVFILAVIGSLIIYISIKEGRFVNIFKQHFGLGDLVFFLCVAPLFATNNFILFFITGIVFSGCTHLIVSQNRAGETVPLAGYLAIYLIILKTIDLTSGTNLFYAELI